MKYNVGDKVIHCRDGLSSIVDIVKMGEIDYFLLKSIYGDEDNIYVPINTADKIIRPIMDKKSADELILFMRAIPKEFNPNTKQRRDFYKKKISTGDVHDFAYLVKQLFFYQNEGPNSGMKLGALDINMLKYAADIIIDELTITLSMSREEVEKYIQNKLK